MTAVSVLAQLTEKRDALPDWVHQPSQAATYPRAFVDVAVGRGADRSDLLSRAGVAEQCFVDPGGKFSLYEVACIVAAAHELTGDHCLGFSTGDSMLLTAHGNLGYALMCAPTVREAIDILERYWHLRGRGVRLQVHSEADSVFLELTAEITLSPMLSWLMLSSILTSMLRGVQFLIPVLPDVLELWLPGERPADFDRWQARLPPVRFARPRLGLYLSGDMGLLDQTLPTANPEALRTALEQCERESLLIERDDDIVHQVRSLLVPGPEGYPSPEQVADQLHQTPRTLRRRLQERGCNYQQLLEEARVRDSRRLLQQADLEVRRIGEMLGYLNPANFTRAFKGWTGMTPREWRRQNGAEPG
ncbi:MAG: AraC family transcriptional regulator ligand-binding domain-containing protein [Pseudomonadota bacterium]|nr:AraC family transcriptional regulator ligand-binding domain-containing protein [Pseudomonadota bacterium]MEE3320944.1 AraC family transcriptional regulator ligand-binding domain-containing protein [Pseudomonadota bacterium]